MSGKGRDTYEAHRLPDSDRLVEAARGKKGAISREGDGGDPVRMRVERRELLP